jgi:hypothetical protein
MIRMLRVYGGPSTVFLNVLCSVTNQTWPHVALRERFYPSGYALKHLNC